MNKAREASGIYLKPKDLMDFLSQQMGKALIPDRFIDILKVKVPRMPKLRSGCLREQDCSEKFMLKRV